MVISLGYYTLVSHYSRLLWEFSLRNAKFLCHEGQNSYRFCNLGHPQHLLRFGSPILSYLLSPELSE